MQYNQLNTGSDTVRIVRTTLEQQDTLQVLKQVYGPLYPEVQLKTEMQSDSAITLITYLEDHQPIATARLVYDGSNGLPDEAIMSQQLEALRKEGKTLAEVGRFAIAVKSRTLVKAYYRAFFLLAAQNHIDSLVFLVKQKDMTFHQEVIGTRVLVQDIQQSFGSDHKFCCCEWPIRNTAERFFSWVGLDHTSIPSDIYSAAKGDI